MTPSEEHHLHPLSWLFIAAGWLKGLIVPAIVFVLLSGRGAAGVAASYEIWSLLLVMPAVGVAFIKYRVFRYRLDSNEMVVRDGILVRNERHIPYARIQNIDLVRNPVHRWLGVALVRLETAGGSRPEAVMRVLSLDAVDVMRARVFADRQTGAAEMLGGVGAGVEEDAPLLKMSVADVVRLGVISNRGFVVVAAALGILSQVDWWEYAGLGELEENPAEWTAALRRFFEAGDGAAPLWLEWLSRDAMLGATALVVAALALFVVLLQLFSIAWHLVTLYDFTLHRRGHELRAEYGLLTRVSATVPTPRIQLLSTKESPLHRWFGSATIQVETAGGASEDGDVDFEGGGQTEQKWLAPLVEAERVAELFRAVLPEIDLDTVQWEPVATRAWKRIFKKACVGVLVTVVAAAMWIGAWALLPLLAGLALAYAYARGYVRYAAYALTPRAILFRDGWLVRRLSAVRFNKAQTVELHHSPFDRRHRMAGVHVDTAGAGKVGHKIRVPYLEADEAASVHGRIYREASRTSFRW